MTLTGGFYGAYWGLSLPFERYGRPFTGEEVKRRVLTVPFLRGYLASFTLLKSPTHTTVMRCALLCADIDIYLSSNGIEFRGEKHSNSGWGMSGTGCLKRLFD
jgi:hypothetical protein